MTDGHGQSEVSGYLFLQWLFENATTGSVGAAASGFQEQMGRLGKTIGQFRGTPGGQVSDGEGWGIG